MKGALTLFSQDAASWLICYTEADIQREEADDQALRFLSFWKKIQRGVQPTLVFDSKFITCKKLFNLKRAVFSDPQRRTLAPHPPISFVARWSGIGAEVQVASNVIFLYRCDG